MKRASQSLDFLDQKFLLAFKFLHLLLIGTRQIRIGVSQWIGLLT